MEVKTENGGSRPAEVGERITFPRAGGLYEQGKHGEIRTVKAVKPKNKAKLRRLERRRAEREWETKRPRAA